MQWRPPLIKGVDLPNSALCEDAVLVESDQLAQNFRCKLVGHDGVRRAVPLKDPMGDQPISRAFALHFLGGFAEGKRFSLSENICEQHIVMPAKFVKRLVERDKVARDQTSSLMD